MKTFWSLASAAVTVVLLVGGLLAFFLCIYIALQDLAVKDHSQSIAMVADALWTSIREEMKSGSIRPAKPDQIRILDTIGNSLIMLVSLAAIAFSTLTVRSKLQGVQEKLPYQKFDMSFFWRMLQNLPFVEHQSRLHRAVNSRIERHYVNLRVKKMVHYYKNSDRLLIASGNYSWLFNSRWSAEVRQIIFDKMPNNVCLISNKTPQEVAEFWKTHCANLPECKKFFEIMSFTRPENEYNGSIVRTKHESLYIYLYREPYPSRRGSSVCVFRGHREARELVLLVQDEFERLYKTALEDPERNDEKKRILSDPRYFGRQLAAVNH